MTTLLALLLVASGKPSLAKSNGAAVKPLPAEAILAQCPRVQDP